MELLRLYLLGFANIRFLKKFVNNVKLIEILEERRLTTNLRKSIF